MPRSATTARPTDPRGNAEGGPCPVHRANQPHLSDPLCDLLKHALNYRLDGLVTYTLGSTVYYGGYFKPSTAGQYLRLDRTASAFAAELSQLFSTGYRLGAWSTYRLNGVTYYNAVYNPATTAQQVGLTLDGLSDASYDTDMPPAVLNIHSQLQNTHNTWFGQGYRVAGLAVDDLFGGVLVNADDWPR